MERVVEVDQAVFAGADPVTWPALILEGAGRIGNYRGRALHAARAPRARRWPRPPGDAFAGRRGPRRARRVRHRRPPSGCPQRSCPRSARSLGLDLPPQQLYLVPLASEQTHVGTLALIDPDGETPDDRLMEAYASRAAAAYLHAARGRA